MIENLLDPIVLYEEPGVVAETAAGIGVHRV
jgi:hypothetical protein